MVLVYLVNIRKSEEQIHLQYNIQYFMLQKWFYSLLLLNFITIFFSACWDHIAKFFIVFELESFLFLLVWQIFSDCDMLLILLMAKCNMSTFNHIQITTTLGNTSVSDFTFSGKTIRRHKFALHPCRTIFHAQFHNDFNHLVSKYFVYTQQW